MTEQKQTTHLTDDICRVTLNQWRDSHIVVGYYWPRDLSVTRMVNVLQVVHPSLKAKAYGKSNEIRFRSASGLLIRFLPGLVLLVDDGADTPRRITVKSEFDKFGLVPEDFPKESTTEETPMEDFPKESTPAAEDPIVADAEKIAKVINIYGNTTINNSGVGYCTGGRVVEQEPERTWRCPSPKQVAGNLKTTCVEIQGPDGETIRGEVQGKGMGKKLEEGDVNIFDEIAGAAPLLNTTGTISATIHIPNLVYDPELSNLEKVLGPHEPYCSHALLSEFARQERKMFDMLYTRKLDEATGQEMAPLWMLKSLMKDLTACGKQAFYKYFGKSTSPLDLPVYLEKYPKESIRVGWYWDKDFPRHDMVLTLNAVGIAALCDIEDNIRIVFPDGHSEHLNRGQVLMVSHAKGKPKKILSDRSHWDAYPDEPKCFDLGVHHVEFDAQVFDWPKSVSAQEMVDYLQGKIHPNYELSVKEGTTRDHFCVKRRYPNNEYARPQYAYPGSLIIFDVRGVLHIWTARDKDTLLQALKDMKA